MLKNVLIWLLFLFCNGFSRSLFFQFIILKLGIILLCHVVRNNMLIITKRLNVMLLEATELYVMHGLYIAMYTQDI